jgi:DNA-directed RNA polymerase beta' subunit
MEIDLYNVDTFVKINDLKEVTNPIYLNEDRTATNDGIFSFEIFGNPGTRDRKENFAYIDLNCKVMHPLMYKQLTLMDARIKGLLEKTRSFTLDATGELVEDSEFIEENSGFDWLYKNLKKISFRKGDSDLRQLKMTLIDKVSIDEIFISKVPVLPAFYRDLNFSKIATGKISIDDINELYLKVLTLSMAVRRSNTMGIVRDLTQIKLQRAVNDLYNFITSKTSGKTGFVKQYMTGKAIDYAARLVITTDKSNEANSYKDLKVKTSEIGVPLHALYTIFKPFVNKKIRELFSDSLTRTTRLYYNDSVQGYVDLLSETLSDNNIEKIFSLFKNSIEDRFNIIYVEDKEGKKSPYLFNYENLKRPFTIADLFFTATYIATKDKYVFATRYPIDSHQNTNPVKPVILTTEKTITLELKFEGGKPGSVYDRIEGYPDIRYRDLWRDAIVLDNTMTSVYGADFDGDQMALLGLFTTEANLEAKALINSPTTFIRSDGTPARGLSNEAILSLYMLTKEG